jgi:hypothetical protein
LPQEISQGNINHIIVGQVDIVPLSRCIAGDDVVIKGTGTFLLINVRLNPIRDLNRPDPGGRRGFVKGQDGTVNIYRTPDILGINPAKTDKVVFYLCGYPGHKGGKDPCFRGFLGKNPAGTEGQQKEGQKDTPRFKTGGMGCIM